MKNPNCFLIAGIIAFLFLTCLPSALAVEQAPDANSSNKNITKPNTLDPNLAAFAAADYLPAFYPGNWEFFNHLVCYDLDGQPAAYVIIFRDPNSTIKTWEEVTAQLRKASDELDELDRQIRIIQASQETPQEDKDKLIKERTAQRTSTLRKSYLSGDFAIVVTGATDQSELLIRCYRGLPEIIVKQPDMQKELNKKYPNTEFEFGQIIYLSSSDICYEVKPKKTAQQNFKLEESYVIYPKEKTLISIKELKEKLQIVTAEKEKQLANLSSEARNMLEEAEIKGKLDNAAKWAEYKAIYLNEKSQQKKKGGK